MSFKLELMHVEENNNYLIKHRHCVLQYVQVGYWK